MKNPVIASSPTATGYAGANAASVSNTPNPNAAPITTYAEGRPVRRLDTRAPTSAPTASDVVSSPNEAAPRWNTVLDTSARVSWKLNPSAPITSISAIGSSRSGRPAAYRRPSAMRVSRRARTAVVRCSSRGRIAVSAANVAAYVAQLSRKTGPVPISDRAMPASAGPMMRAELKIAELSEIAFGSRSGPTISEANAWRVGLSIALTVPRQAASAITCQSWIVPVMVSTPSVAATSPAPTLVHRSRCRLSYRSASRPP